MDTLQALLRAIEQEPDDLTAGKALTDFLVEERDMQFSEAERYAERVLESARDARDLAAAAELLEHPRPWHHRLLLDMLLACGQSHSLLVTVFLVPGDIAPLHAQYVEVVSGETLPRHTITVGALWVIKCFRANQHKWAPRGLKRERFNHYR